MEIAEAVAIAIGGLTDESCPFSVAAEGVDDDEPESVKRDDGKGAATEQENNGGELGKNLITGSPGRAGTICEPALAPQASPSARRDTPRVGTRATVLGASGIPTDDYPYILAAHHLIPGEASLAPSKLKSFMTKGASVEVQTTQGTKTKQISKHIGYNVNGAHNGVWLGGNYAIRATTSPTKQTWSEIKQDDWCLNYVAAVAKATGGQFHDAHRQYNEVVEDLLNKIHAILQIHSCEECDKPTINPPFRIKTRLYNLSAHFRGRLIGPPTSWRRPWFTSDRWRDKAFTFDKPSNQFLAAYSAAKAT